VVIRGAVGQIYHRSYNGTAWSGWNNLGGVTVSAPAAVASSANRLDLWVRGTDNGLQHKFWQPSTGWSGWSADWSAGPQP